MKWTVSRALSLSAVFHVDEIVHKTILVHARVLEQSRDLIVWIWWHCILILLVSSQCVIALVCLLLSMALVYSALTTLCTCTGVHSMHRCHLPLGKRNCTRSILVSLYRLGQWVNEHCSLSSLPTTHSFTVQNFHWSCCWPWPFCLNFDPALFS